MSEYVWHAQVASHVAFGDARSLPLSCRSSLSHFQSGRGCIKGPGFSPNQHSSLSCKTPLPCVELLENFCMKAPEWIESFFLVDLRICVQVLVRCKNRPFPNFWSWETAAVCWKDYHIFSGVWHRIALYAEGSPKLYTKKKKKIPICQETRTKPQVKHITSQYCVYVSMPQITFYVIRKFTNLFKGNKDTFKEPHKVLTCNLVS